jgi:class 3 adenylate cyclase
MSTRTRIKVAVMGAAANEAARIEALCKTLDARLEVSDQIANQARCPSTDTTCAEWRR